MRRSEAIAGLLAALLWAAAAGPAAAQAPPAARLAIAAEKGDGGYRPVKDKRYAAVRQRVIAARALERLRDFLSPVRLPRAVDLVAEECEGGAGMPAYYLRGERRIRLCYQFVAYVEKTADEVMRAVKREPARFPLPVTRDEFIWGFLANVLLHESGHALFDVLDVPVFGSEEDAADQIGIFVALQLNPKLAETAIKAFAYFWQPVPSPDALTKTGALNEDYADEHGQPAQRLANGLCIAFGQSPAAFAAFRAWLPPERAAGCAAEYAQIRTAFAKTVLPFVDAARMHEVRAMDWLARDFSPAK
jgi:hypothetical protein